MLKLKTICKVIVGTSVNVFSQSHHGYLAWESSPEVIGSSFGDESVVEMYTVMPERLDRAPYITIVVA